MAQGRENSGGGSPVGPWRTGKHLGVGASLLNLFYPEAAPEIVLDKEKGAQSQPLLELTMRDERLGRLKATARCFFLN